MSNNPTNLPLKLYDEDSFPWEIDEDGSVRYGRIVLDSNTGEEYFEFYGSLTNNYYGYDYDISASTEDNGREVFIAPRFIGDGYGGDLPISVSRKIYVSEDESFVRFLDIVTNTDSQPQTYDFTVENYLPYLQSNVVKTSSGDSIFTLDDNWIVVDSTYQKGSFSNTFNMLQVIAGSGGYRPSQVSTSTSSGANFTYGLDLAPGETQIIMHFAARNSNVATALAKGDQLALLDMNALAGITQEEKSQVINFNTGVNNNLPPDLVVSNIETDNTIAILNGIVTYTWTVENQGQGTVLADKSITGLVYISDDNILDENDIGIDSWSQYLEEPLTLNNSLEIEEEIYLGSRYIAPGNKYLIVEVDSYNYQSEANESNNFVAVPITLKAPDLTVTEAKIKGITNPFQPLVLSWGEQVSVSWTIKNQGDVPAFDWSGYSIIFSEDLNFDPTDKYLINDSIYAQTPLAAGAEYTIDNKVLTIPSNITGSGYLLFVADSQNSQGETNENNNFFALPTPIEIKVADLQISASINTNQPIAPGEIISVTPGETISVSWTVTNQGNGTATADWGDYVYLSNDNTYNPPYYSWRWGYVPGDTYLISELISQQTPLAAGASYQINNKIITIPTTAQTGTQYLLFMADGYTYYSSSNQPETNPFNNVFAIPIQIITPDLLISEPTVQGTPISGGKISVGWTVTNRRRYSEAVTRGKIA